MSRAALLWLPLSLLTLSGCTIHVTSGSGGTTPHERRSENRTTVVHRHEHVHPSPAQPTPAQPEPAARPRPRYVEKAPVAVAPRPTPATPKPVRTSPRLDTAAGVPVTPARPAPRPNPALVERAPVPLPARPSPTPAPRDRSVSGGGTAYERADRTVPKTAD